MSRFVVVVNTQDVITAFANSQGGTVLQPTYPNVGGKVAAVVHFGDGTDAHAASILVGGTLHGSEWTARYAAKEKRWERDYEAPSQDGGYVDDPPMVYVGPGYWA